MKLGLDKIKIAETWKPEKDEFIKDSMGFKVNDVILYMGNKARIISIARYDEPDPHSIFKFGLDGYQVKVMDGPDRNAIRNIYYSQAQKLPINYVETPSLPKRTSETPKYKLGAGEYRTKRERGVR